MGASDVLFITLSHSVSFLGKAWWTLMLALRLLLLLLAGFPLFSDEQERFVCNTIQPGCSNVCFDAFAPVSVFRLWLFHLILLALPHLLFATYVAHKVFAHPGPGGFYCAGSRGGSPVGLENRGSSRELSLLKSRVQEPRGPRFYCAYVLVVVLRILLEAAFGAGQFYLFGLSFPKSFLCYEAPCTSGVECYVSRRTEKSLMMSFMLGVSSLSVLLSLVDLMSSMKALVRWRSRREVLAEELIRGEQSSVLTATTMAEDGDKSPRSKNHPDSKDPQVDTPPTPRSTPAPSQDALNSHPRPPLSPRPDREPSSKLRAPAPVGGGDTGQHGPARTNSGQQSDSSDSQERRAWV
eukprot:XP_011615051.1 PREDICTED: gap junction delta-4 protein-like [Takifugu rubripes]